MIRRNGQWMEVRVGAYIADLTGKVWRVTHDARGHVGLLDRDGERKIVPRKADHESVVVLDATEAEAMSALATHLGAEVVAERSAPGEPWRCPPITSTESARVHLGIVHGLYPDPSVDAVALHEREHADGLLAVPHHHG